MRLVAPQRRTFWKALLKRGETDVRKEPKKTIAARAAISSIGDTVVGIHASDSLRSTPEEKGVNNL